MSKKWPWARKMWKLLAQRTSWNPWSYSIFFSEPWRWMFIHGLIDWQKHLRLLDWVTRFFSTSGATYGGVPQHLRPSGRSLPLWRKTVANPKSEIFKLSEKEIYKKNTFLSKQNYTTNNTYRVFNKSRWLGKFASYFTHHLLFFGIYPNNENRVARDTIRERVVTYFWVVQDSCAVTE